MDWKTHDLRGNSLPWVFPLQFCKQITSSLAGALPSVFLKGFRPLEANIWKANARENEKNKQEKKKAQILHLLKCSPHENKPAKSW